jgi:hypothetical protein
VRSEALCGAFSVLIRVVCVGSSNSISFVSRLLVLPRLLLPSLSPSLPLSLSLSLSRPLSLSCVSMSPPIYFFYLSIHLPLSPPIFCLIQMCPCLLQRCSWLLSPPSSSVASDRYVAALMHSSGIQGQTAGLRMAFIDAYRHLGAARLFLLSSFGGNIALQDRSPKTIPLVEFWRKHRFTRPLSS